MEEQNVDTVTTEAPAVENPEVEVTPSPGQDPEIEAAPSEEEQPQVFNISEDPDLSSFANEDNTGFDHNKIRELIKEKETIEKSRNFFQSKYQEKEKIPDKADKYMEGFKPDPKYKDFMDNEVAKNTIKSITEYAKEHNIGKNATQAFVDWALQKQVEANVIDTRTADQKAAEIADRDEEMMKQVTPMLKSLNRTFGENQDILKNFFNGNNPFVANADMRDYMIDLASTSAEGYLLVSMITNVIQGSNPPTLSGTIDRTDKATMQAELDKALGDPNLQEEIMRKYLGQ